MLVPLPYEPPPPPVAEGYESRYLQALRDVRESVLALVKEQKAFELTEFLNTLRVKIEQREGS